MPERDPLNWPGIPDGTPMGWWTDAGQDGESPFSVPSDVKFRLMRRFAWDWPSEMAQKFAARKRRAMSSTEDRAKLDLMMFSTPAPGLPTGPSPPAPTNVEDTARGEAEAKKKRKASGEAKKKEEQHEAALDDAHVAALSRSFDRALDEVERGAFDEFSPDPAGVAAARRLAAERREAYVTGFKIDSRPLAVWAIRKYREAKDWLETIKGVMRAEVDRAKNTFEGREAFFLEKLKDWADTQKRDTGKSIRMPEAASRLEYYKKPMGGLEVTDAEELKAALIKKYGLWDAIERGLVVQKTELVEAQAVAHLSVEANRTGVDGGFAWTPPEEIDAVKVVRVGGKE